MVIAVTMSKHSDGKGRRSAVAICTATSALAERARFGGGYHRRRGVDTGYASAAPPQLERQGPVAAAHVEDIPPFDGARQLEDQSALEPLGDCTDLAGAPCRISFRAEARDDVGRIRIAHRQLACRIPGRQQEDNSITPRNR